MRFLLFIGLLVSATFCKNNTPRTLAEPTNADGNVVELTKDFVDFYQQFHADSVFQLAHIHFPLPEQASEKMPDGSISLKLNWAQKDWKIQTLPPLNTGEFRREFTPMSETLMLEKITTTSPDINYAIERRWAKLDNEWMLIFYSAGMVRG